jgi:hypothetical protein
MKKYSIIVIAPPSDYSREITADGWEATGAGFSYFYLNGKDGNKDMVFVCPTNRLIITGAEESLPIGSI